MKCCIIRARRVAFPKGCTSLCIAGAGFSSASSRGSSLMGLFLLLKKNVENCCCHNNCKGIVESFVLIDIKRQGNYLFQTPNILQCIFCSNLGRITSTFRGWVGAGPPVASSRMVDKDSHYHQEAFLGCDPARTGHTNDCFDHRTILDLVLKLFEH